MKKRKTKTKKTVRAKKKAKAAGRGKKIDRKKTIQAEALNRKILIRPRRSKIGITSIKVVGIGGAGGNIVSRIAQGERIKGVEFVAVNTDAQDLDYVNAHRKVYIGKALTYGLGTGMNPEIGKQAVEENRSELGETLKDTDIVFLTAGMGGGTGSGGIPVLADIAREKGILTVAMVTRPFSFEGAERASIAQDALNRLRERVDALVVIPNDRIFSLIDKDTSVMKAFGYVDDVIKNGIKAISELINVPGIINVDFADIRTSLRDAGTTIIGIGVASGQDRSVKAVGAALNSPLFETSIEGAKSALFSVAGGRDFKMAEVNDIAKAITANLDVNAKVIFGAYNDKGLKDKSVKVTVIASGFNGIWSMSSVKSMPTLFAEPGGSRIEETVMTEGEGEKRGQKQEDLAPRARPAGAKKEEKTEPWDIPAFLRKRRKR